MLKSLFAKMLLIYMTIIMLIILVVGLMVAGIFRSHYIEETKTELNREARELNSILVERYTDDIKRTAAREEIFAIVRKHDVLIQAYFFDSALGRRSFFDVERDTKWHTCEYADLSEWVERIVSGEESAGVYYNILSPYTSIMTATVMAPMTDSEGTLLGVVFLHSDMTGVNTTLDRLYLDVFVSAAIAVLIIAPIVYIITGRVTQPVLHMRKVVAEFTSGRFEKRVTLKSRDELGQLGRSFNVMADELATLERARRSFVANVSHELRSPLTSMSGFLEAMEDGTIPPDEHDKYISVVLDETRRMTGMVNELLDIARIESGQNKLIISLFDITELARRVIITFEARIVAKQLNVEMLGLDEPVMVEADKDRIAQVLHNLTDNAIKFSRDGGGTIAIECRVEDKKAYVSVRDNGCGIDAEELPHIFDRFYKADKAHTYANHSGTGIGLSITKLVLEQHGQGITVESGEDGTEFTFSLRCCSVKR